MTSTTRSLILLSLLAACANNPITMPPPPTPAPEIGGLRILGDQIIVRLSGIGTPKPSASAAVSAPAMRPQTLSRVKLTVSDPAQTVASSSDAFASSGPRSAGKRYLYATVTFTNAGASIDNLAFVAVRTDSDTAIQQLERFPGLPAYTVAERSAIALSIMPTSPVSLDPFTLQPTLISGGEGALQVYTESELPSAELLPYGFKADSSGGRAIPSGGKVTLTIAYRVPLQLMARDDPYSVTMRFQPVQNPQNTITESLEAQQANNRAAFSAATRNTAQLRVLPGTTQPSGEALCRVRTAGAADAPNAYLVNTAPSAVNLSNVTTELTRGQTRPLGATLQLGGSSSMYSFAGVTVSDPTIASIDAGQITALKAGTTDITINTCNQSFTASLTVREQP